MKKKLLLVLAIISIVFITACTNNKSETKGPNDMTVFKSPSCGCCVGWSSYAEDQGFDVDINPMNNMNAVKQKHDIPHNMRSCHTTEIDGYFVEGHVPIEAVNKLLEEQPDIDGIALPGMPSGSAGMPGEKRGEWTIYAIKDGKVSEFMRV